MITIVGCGALGSLFAGTLIDAGFPVQGFSRPGAHQEACRRRGLLVEYPDGSERTYHFPLEDSWERLEPSDLMLVLVKTHQTAAVAPHLPSALKPQGMVLTLQNGLGNAEILASYLSPSQLALGTCTYAAFRPAPGDVRWGGTGEIWLGPWDPATDVSPLIDLFNKADLSAHFTPHPQRALWEKLVVNASLNPVTALARCPNGEVLHHDGLLGVARTLCDEAVQVARAEGFPLEEETLWQRGLAILDRTKNNRSSMLQDVEARRRTEVDAISGAVLDRGKKHRLPLPVTSCVAALIQALDAQGDRS